MADYVRPKNQSIAPGRPSYKNGEQRIPLQEARPAAMVDCVRPKN